MRARIYSLMLPVVIGVLAVLCTGCGDEGTTTLDDRTSGLVEPDQITYNAHIYLYKGGRKTTDLIADEIQHFTRLDSAVAANLLIHFFDSTGERISTLTAQRGYIKEKDNFLAVSGSVVVIGRDSARLETEYLEWDGAKDSVVTDSFVTVIEGGSILMSYGFQSDPELKDITFKRQVSGRLTETEPIEDEDK